MPMGGHQAQSVHPKSLSASVCCRVTHLDFQLKCKVWKKDVADMVKRG